MKEPRRSAGSFLLLLFVFFSGDLGKYAKFSLLAKGGIDKLDIPNICSFFGEQKRSMENTDTSHRKEEAFEKRGFGRKIG
ncbi:MAG: hypothetical protein BAA00_15665 [Parageobacillus thermoglucosidasius]|nr:MAG: hypothetical protein BAA00_15665 [Parageobacillus thermoglucosidasius]